MSFSEERFLEWLNTKHLMLFPNAQWPAAGTSEYEAMFGSWSKLLEKLDASFEELVLASDRMADQGAPFPDHHITDLLKYIKELRAEAKAREKVAETNLAVKERQYRPDMDRATAMQLSRDCPECGDCGFAARKALRYRGIDAHGQRIFDPRDKPYNVALYCRCPAGRWLKDYYRTHDPALFARTHDLQDLIQLWDPEMDHPSWSYTATGELADAELPSQVSAAVWVIPPWWFTWWDEIIAHCQAKKISVRGLGMNYPDAEAKWSRPEQQEYRAKLEAAESRATANAHLARTHGYLPVNLDAQKNDSDIAF